MDRDQLADFLRTRREALQPEDVGLPRGRRRRTGGLRREEVAALCGMSTDYYSRIEQHRGARPSEPMLAALARGLHLSLDERDHLFRLAGHPTPTRELRLEHVDTGLMHVLDRLQDTPAQVVTSLGETLLQTPPAVALLGDETVWTGQDRSMFHRWFTRPESRHAYPPEDHDGLSRNFTADLRALAARHGPRSRAATLVRHLRADSPEFARLWTQHEVTGHRGHHKRITTPHLGVIAVHCQMLYDLDQDQALLVFTATPGTEDHEKLQLLTVVGTQSLPASP
ncbi:helix-turn-helix transcriptional regulator [Streptomyces liangshanensis]|uniref:Helix-turn-helix domain-containing protein n=1 Tax=Streptomyces liangshanensis TaxID=2717324 RepID=A0A6G9GTH5_9ACTN|nr:helix-turn-helix transcriptional regulator [Streptomyces liangshanensis]QIQ01562.1 helix-turn-helix domain-containing protein [Streptomyces liangshanensis]